MPGRRLIFLLVMLLVTLSVLSAGREISQRGPAGQSTTTTQTAPAGTETGGRDRATTTGPEGRESTRPKGVGTVERRLPSAEPVRVRVGERVVLRVRTEGPDIVAVDDLGVRAPTGPGTPGTLDFVAGAAGAWDVTLALAGRRIGEVLVRD